MAKKNEVNVGIKTTADTSGLEKTTKGLKAVEGGAEKATTKTEKLARKFVELGDRIPGGGKIPGFFRGITSGAGKATLALGGVLSALGALAGIIRSGFSATAITEDLTGSFETLLGSAQEAKQRMAEVTEFASKTPLSVEGLGTASKVLTTLTSGALGAADSLQLVGDAAAIAQRPGERLDQTVQNVALHVGRLQAALMSGNGEIGESVMRLTELGLINGSLAVKLRAMHQEVGQGADAWNLLEEALKEFSGEMERRGKNISGKTSNLGEAWTQFTKAVSEPFVPHLKGSLDALTGLLGFLSSKMDDVTESSEAASLVIKQINIDLVELEKATTSGAEAAAAYAETLAATYDGLSDRIEKSTKRAEELRKVQLDIELLRIDSDQSLTPVQKATQKGAATEAAGLATSEGEIKSLTEQLKLNKKQASEALKASIAASREANAADEDATRLAAKVEEVNRAQLQAAKTLQTASAPMREFLATYDKSFPQGAATKRSAHTDNSFGNNKGQVTHADMEADRAKLKTIDAEIIRLGSAGANAGIVSASQTAENAAAMARKKAEELAITSESVAKAGRETAKGIKELIAHEIQKQIGESTLRAGQTASNVFSATEAERKTREAAAKAATGKQGTPTALQRPSAAAIRAIFGPQDGARQQAETLGTTLKGQGDDITGLLNALVKGSQATTGAINSMSNTVQSVNNQINNMATRVKTLEGQIKEVRK